MKFPIDETLPQLIAALYSSQNVVLSAPPGAGKTTRVPLALLKEQWMDKKRLIMLEPRRLAARRAAEFMAALLGESIGRTVGYRTRGDSRVSDFTRIEVVTEGVLTRMLHSQPDLPDVGIVIFDEFHERSINADLGLALTLDVQQNFREDLRVLVMSATVDASAVATLLGSAPVIKSPAKSFGVETRYLPFPVDSYIEPRITDIVHRALQDEHGDILVFLPGQREIRRVEKFLQDRALAPEVIVHTLYGEASDEQQRAALTVHHGRRKVILSTSIAETSLTIDGVRIVVDSGFSRSARFDPRRGMTGLVTTPVSQATADQRRGRAGRQEPGICYRLWTEPQHANLPRYPTPEILVADLAPLALDLALWGSESSTGLRFLDSPPSAHLSRARTLLHALGALDKRHILTPHGKAMTELPIHPRLAHMIIRGHEIGLGAPACDVAALLAERDLFRGQPGKDVDLASRLHALRSGSATDRRAQMRITAESRRLRNMVGLTDDETAQESKPGVLLALAYPERIGRRRGTEGRRYQMSGGTGAVLPDWSTLVREEFLAIAEVDGAGTEARVLLAAPIQKSDIVTLFADSMVTMEEVFWSEQQETVVARNVQYLEALTLAEHMVEIEGDRVQVAMLEGIGKMGLGCLPMDRESHSLRTRSEWARLHQLVTDDWPVLDDATLLGTIDQWLGPFLNDMTKRSDLKKLEMLVILKSLFTHVQLKKLDTLAPTELEVPTGSQIKLEYGSGDQPILAVRLQEMFGLMNTPMIGNGRVRVLVHLLSPAGRPLAVTQDLQSFWKNSYPEVRKQMRGRYPKHHWPEDPLLATPTLRTGKNRPRDQ